ncbi:hypothetical protein DFH06DRAFT_1126760 [Mycena polygramma]|nr:hypothetical protein DFH06DRAFT_1126760 [Mycena polygramma]
MFMSLYCAHFLLGWILLGMVKGRRVIILHSLEADSKVAGRPTARQSLTFDPSQIPEECQSACNSVVDNANRNRDYRWPRYTESSEFLQIYYRYLNPSDRVRITMQSQQRFGVLVERFWCRHCYWYNHVEYRPSPSIVSGLSDISTSLSDESVAFYLRFSFRFVEPRSIYRLSLELDVAAHRFTWRIMRYCVFEGFVRRLPNKPILTSIGDLAILNALYHLRNVFPPTVQFKARSTSGFDHNLSASVKLRLCGGARRLENLASLAWVIVVLNGKFLKVPVMRWS